MSGDRWFAFLRAINTGDRRLTNERLLEPFEAMGFVDVAAYQAAGNLTFLADSPPDESEIETTLATAYGFETPTFVRSASEVAAVVDADPFTPAELAESAGKVQVSFIRSAPTDDEVVALHELIPAEDRVAVIGREWYWLPAEGISASKLPVGRVEQLLGDMTIRTVGTIQRMAARFS